MSGASFFGSVQMRLDTASHPALRSHTHTAAPVAGHHHLMMRTALPVPTDVPESTYQHSFLCSHTAGNPAHIIPAIIYRLVHTHGAHLVLAVTGHEGEVCCIHRFYAQWAGLAPILNNRNPSVHTGDPRKYTAHNTWIKHARTRRGRHPRTVVQSLARTLRANLGTQRKGAVRPRKRQITRPASPRISRSLSSISRRCCSAATPTSVSLQRAWFAATIGGA